MGERFVRRWTGHERMGVLPQSVGWGCDFGPSRLTPRYPVYATSSRQTARGSDPLRRVYRTGVGVFLERESCCTPGRVI